MLTRIIRRIEEYVWRRNFYDKERDVCLICYNTGHPQIRNAMEHIMGNNNPICIIGVKCICPLSRRIEHITFEEFNRLADLGLLGQYK